MKIANVPIDSIHADPANVRRHPQRNLDCIKASLARFGQQKPIVVDAAGIVRAGNGTLDAARSLGWEKIAVVRTPLAGTEATAYSIADNRTGELAEWDETGLAETLRALQSEDFYLAAVGYDAGQVDALLEKLSGEIVNDPQGEWHDMPEFEHEDKTDEAAFIIRVFLKDEQDLEDFGKLLGKDLTGRKFVWFSDQPHSPVIEAVDSLIKK
ncbi:MAG: hypothetical protein ACXVBB_05010 [Isosphaeraceae bacterium]